MWDMSHDLCGLISIATLRSMTCLTNNSLTVAVLHKRPTHDVACNDRAIDFVPLAVVALGGKTAEAIFTVQAIVHTHGSHLCLPAHEYSPHLLPEARFGRGTLLCGPRGSTGWFRG